MRRARRLAVAPLAAVAVGVFAEGGYSPAARVAFGCAALAALALVLVAGARPPLRDPVVVSLIALAALGALSSLWTIGPVDRTLIWSLVTLGYAALVLCGAVAETTAIAAGIAALALVAGVGGLADALTGTGPWAQLMRGTWRPGGPFEYPPALALLQVTALPIYLAGVRSRRRWLIAASTAGLVVAAAALAQSGSRLGLALGIAVAGFELIPRRYLPVVLVLAAVVGAIAFGTGGRDLLHGRAHLWRAGVETWADRPLAGSGADAFLAGSVIHQHGETILFAHDLPLELAAELGVAGLALAIALYAFTIRALWRARGTPAARLLGPGALVFLIAGLVDWPWHLAGAGAIWAVSTGTVLASKR
jgi:O-antigen ligase